MNTDNNVPHSKEYDMKRGVALHEAVHDLYATLTATRHMVGEGRSRPKAILRQLDALEAKVDTVYIEASVHEIAAHDLLKIAEELRRAYEVLLKDTETAYTDGWQAGWEEALRQMEDNAPRGSGVVVAWLIHALASDTAWREPAWEGVIALIREAQQYLAANTEKFDR